MRAGSPPSATVPSTALFKDSNLSAAIRSLVATRCPTSGGINARAIGPNATHNANTSHTERRSVFLEADEFRHSRAARSDTTKTAMAAATLNNGAYDAAIASQVEKEQTRPYPSKYANRRCDGEMQPTGV